METGTRLDSRRADLRVADAPEGDGWIIATIHSKAANRSSLGIFNAQDIASEPAAMLDLPRRVPAGFHGNWVDV